MPKVYKEKPTPRVLSPNWKDTDKLPHEKVPHPMPKDKLHKKRLIKRCDIWFSKKIRERDGKCLRCGKLDHLQCAHLISRTYKHLRWDEKNAITLCMGCHMFFWHTHPIEAAEFARATIPDNYSYILKERYKSLPPLSVPELEEITIRLRDVEFAPLEVAL